MFFVEYDLTSHFMLFTVQCRIGAFLREDIYNSNSEIQIHVWSYWKKKYTVLCYLWTQLFPSARFNGKAVKHFQVAINAFDENKLGQGKITDGDIIGCSGKALGKEFDAANKCKCNK